MSRESTIRDLRVKVRQLETKKREIDKQVVNLHGAIRVFEQNGDTEHGDRLLCSMPCLTFSQRPLP